MSARYSFNVEAFALFLHVKIKALAEGKDRDLTMQQAADAAGVTKATIYRAVHRQPIASGNVLALCLWLGTNPFAFLIDGATGRGLSDLPDASASRET